MLHYIFGWNFLTRFLDEILALDFRPAFYQGRKSTDYRHHRHHRHHKKDVFSYIYVVVLVFVINICLFFNLTIAWNITLGNICFVLQMWSYGRFHFFILTRIYHKFNKLRLLVTTFYSFYITWPPLHNPMPPRGSRYTFFIKIDLVAWFFKLCCWKMLEKV